MQEDRTTGAWRARLPALVAECRELWQLRLGPPFAGGTVSAVLAVTLPDGRAGVLKLGLPHRESEREADALALWEGGGAVQLLAEDRERHALLLERCTPGTPLSELPQDEALDVAVQLLPRLWRSAGEPFRPLAEEAAWWAESLPRKWQASGRPFEQRLLDAALDALQSLPATQGEQVLVNQDLHAGNVLRAEREPWLALDPKPLVGEREFGIAPLVRGAELGGRRKDVLHRLDRLTGELGLDRERARAWTLAQTLAWSFEDGRPLPHHLEIPRWLLQA